MLPPAFTNVTKILYKQYLNIYTYCCEAASRYSFCETCTVCYAAEVDEGKSHFESVDASDLYPFSINYFQRELGEIRNLKLPITSDITKCPLVNFSTGSSYNGEWKDMQRWGFGEQNWSDGAFYIGSWKANYAEGNGIFCHSDSDRYVGQWAKGFAYGIGVYHKVSGATYCGTWKHDLQDGYGVEISGTSRYEGQYAKGKREGGGIVFFTNGASYCGMWKGNKFCGYGTFVAADGRTYRGEWKNGCMHGFGEYHWPDGRTYLGEYYHAKKVGCMHMVHCEAEIGYKYAMFMCFTRCKSLQQGMGIMMWNTKSKHVGYWKGGKQHGPGRFFLNESTVRKGIWSNGKMVKHIAWEIS